MKTILIKKKKKYHEDDLLTDYSDQQENNYQQDSATRTLDMNTHTKKNQKIGLILNTKIVQNKKPRTSGDFLQLLQDCIWFYETLNKNPL